MVGDIGYRNNKDTKDTDSNVILTCDFEILSYMYNVLNDSEFICEIFHIH